MKLSQFRFKMPVECLALEPPHKVFENEDGTVDKVYRRDECRMMVIHRKSETIDMYAKDAEGNVTKLDMPDTSNVLQWFCEDGTKCSVRPSGTEPKIKFYIEVKDASFSGAADYERCSKAGEAKIELLKKDLKL